MDEERHDKETPAEPRTDTGASFGPDSSWAASEDPPERDAGFDDVLIEEVSIDGMCGVY